jgi:hypothetical protein
VDGYPAEIEGRRRDGEEPVACCTHHAFKEELTSILREGPDEDPLFLSFVAQFHTDFDVELLARPNACVGRA